MRAPVGFLFVVTFLCLPPLSQARQKLLVIGDSISGGYRPTLATRLGDSFEVSRIGENGKDTRNGLQKLETWLGETKWDVVVFNWGLHDMKHGHLDALEPRRDEYLKRLERLVLRLKETEARLIFVTTTPVPEPNKAGRLNAYVVSFNEAAIALMKQHQVEVCDAYSVIFPVRETYELPSKKPKWRDVHFTKGGYQILGRAVSKTVLTTDE